jgi:hypothetical protein
MELVLRAMSNEVLSSYLASTFDEYRIEPTSIQMRKPL